MLARLLKQLLGSKNTSSAGAAAPAVDNVPAKPVAVAQVSERQALKSVAELPNCAEAHNDLGAIYLRSDRLAEAEAECRLATKLQPENARIHFNLGNVFAATERPQAAEASYRMAIELKPDFAEAHHRLGAILAGGFRQAEEVACFRQALALRPDFAEANDDLARALRRIERVAQIEAQDDSAVAAQPDSVDAHLSLGQFFETYKRFPEAEVAYQRALELQPYNVTACYGLATVFYQTKRLFDAEQAYRHTIRLMPDFPDVHEKLGQVLAKTRRLAEAEACYRRALSLAPGFSEAHNNLGVLLEANGHPLEAAVCYRKALMNAADPEIEGAQNNLANVEREIGRLNRLEAACRAELGAKAGDVTLLNKLGRAVLALGRVEEASAVFNQALTADPDLAATHVNLALASMKQGDADAAIASLRAALSITPNDARALAKLGTAYAMKGDLTAATECNEQVLAADPRHVEANHNLAVIALQAGRLEDAQNHFAHGHQERSLGVEDALHPLRTVLVLGTLQQSNVPPKTIEFIFPASINTRISWVMEYAEDDQADNLPYFDLVFNGIGYLDFADDIARPLGRFLASCAKPVLNPPHKVLRTARDQLPQLLAGIPHTLVPPVWRFDSSADWDDAMAEKLPLLVRPLDSHGGDDLVLIRTASELATTREKQNCPLYFSRFVDFRSADSWFRKYRTIYVGREAYPYHLAISRDWMVHYFSADMEQPWKLEEEKLFLQNQEAVLGAAGMRAIRAIGERMDLDYAGIDFSIMPDGQILVFEANPMILVHPENLYGPLAHKNAAIYRISEKFEEMLKTRAPAQALV
jgi:tetratricopeptide (TPR) repeat protein